MRTKTKGFPKGSLFYMRNKNSVMLACCTIIFNDFSL